MSDTLPSIQRTEQMFFNYIKINPQLWGFFSFISYLSYMRRITESELIRLVRRVIKEETSGHGDFIETLRSNFNMSDELVGFVSDFIENSNCNKIEFAKFKYAALGASLHNGVLINDVVLRGSL